MDGRLSRNNAFSISPKQARDRYYCVTDTWQLVSNLPIPSIVRPAIELESKSSNEPSFSIFDFETGTIQHFMRNSLQTRVLPQADRNYELSVDGRMR